MSPVLTREKIEQSPSIDSLFIKELLNQIRLADRFQKYSNCSNELLLKQFIHPDETSKMISRNLNFDPLNQILVTAFYKAIALIIEKKTGQKTDAFIYLKNKEFSSAVISCGGVLVLYSLIWGYRSLSFSSLQKLIESAETNIRDAMIKANRYLDI